MKHIVYKAVEIAYWFLIYGNKQDECDITNLKLQKLCYYAFCYYLRIKKQKLFNEKIEAWQFGPVIKEVYEEFKKFGKDILKTDLDYNDLNIKDNEIISCLQKVYDFFASYSALTLTNNTHNEKPWKKCYKENKKEEITFEYLLAFANSPEFNFLDK